MKTQLKAEPEIVVESLDDIPLLISLQQKLLLSELIDEAIPRHWHHEGLSVGQLVVGWNTYILSEADHRKVAVEDWAVEHQSILSQLLGRPLRRTDFTDDRLSQVLTHLSKEKVWSTIETMLWANSVNVYRLTSQRVRLDATRFSGYHTPTEEGLMQHGYNQKTPQLAQVKLMAASIDCSMSGHLLATDVISGDKADDGLYLPIYRRIRETFLEKGLLYTGDSKMSALKIRGEIASSGDFYLVPLAKVGEVAKRFDDWVSDIVEGVKPATLIYNTDDHGQRTDLIAAGYQTTRCQQMVSATGEAYTWDERILVVRSLSDANKQLAALERNIAEAEKALYLRRFSVPFDALAYVFGRDAMFWYRATVSLGRNSLVGTTVKKPKDLPAHLVADEKHTRRNGKRVYIATTVANGCFLGAEVSEQADTESLTDAYGVFGQEAKALDIDYAPVTVTTDGWQATDAAFLALFPKVTILLCFLHAFLKLRRRAKRLKASWTTLRKKLWTAYRAKKRAIYSQRLRRLNEWVQQHISLDSVRGAMSRIAANVARYSQAYQHPGAPRTTNMVDRLINYQDRILFDMQLFHGTLQSANLAARAMALLWNFHPYGSRTRSSAKSRVSPFADLNGFQYHDNWLQNLLIAASRAGNPP